MGMLVMFFDLFTGASVSPVKDPPHATKLQIKHLAQLIVQESKANDQEVNVDMCRRVMDVLYTETLCAVHRKWLEMIAAKPGLTIMDFMAALRHGLDINVIFWNKPCNGIDALRL